MIDIQEEATVSRTVLREDGLRAVLFGFDKDQALSEHTAAMPVIIQVLEGKLRVGGEGREVELTAGGIVYLSAVCRTPSMSSNPARCCCRCSTTAADSVNDWQSRMRS